MMNNDLLNNHLADFNLKMTGTVAFGAANAGALLAGKEKPTGPGAILEISFEGEVIGPKLSAKVSNGIDYVTIRPDGRRDLDIRATLTTDDGSQIAYRALGVALNVDNRLVVRKQATLFTRCESYLWVNDLQLWVTGDADLAEKLVRLHAYSV